MDDQLPAVRTPEPTSLQEHLERVSHYAESALSANTRRGYRADWTDFSVWCKARSADSLPASPETVASYLADRAQSLRTSTLARRKVAISQAHELAGMPSPCKDARVRTVWQGIAREHGAPPVKKRALALSDLRMLVASCGDDLIGRRDRAILLVGFTSGMRRSEIVSLNVQDMVVEEGEGIKFLLRRSKTDQHGAGREIGVPVGRQSATCPVLAIRAWIHAAGISEGPLFRSFSRWGTIRNRRLSAFGISLIIKRRTASLGLDSRQYSGHSLRSGLVSACAKANVPEHAIMKATGHRSVATLRQYIQSASVLRDHPAKSLDM